MTIGNASFEALIEFASGKIADVECGPNPASKFFHNLVCAHEK